MTHLGPASCPFTIGSAVLRKNIKKKQPVNLEDMPITCGTLLQKRPFIDVGPRQLETERRAEYDRQAAYDTRAEFARREEYDRRLEYDRLMRPSLHPQILERHKETFEVTAGCDFSREEKDKLTVRKIVKINRKLHPNPSGEKVCMWV